MRPIDADGLIQDILNDTVIDCDTAVYFVNKVNGMETVFDMDKVLDQLEKASYELYDSSPFADQRQLDINDALEIVKAGGKDE